MFSWGFGLTEQHRRARPGNVARTPQNQPEIANPLTRLSIAHVRNAAIEQTPSKLSTPQFSDGCYLSLPIGRAYDFQRTPKEQPWIGVANSACS
jgi:hypothetical protein